MENNLLDLLPRILTNDGHTLLPGEYQIEMCNEFPIILALQRRYLDSDARLDRQSPFDDKNGKRIFENDTVIIHNFGNYEWLVVVEKNGAFKVKAINKVFEPFFLDDDLVGQGLEITGTLPWEEKE